MKKSTYYRDRKQTQILLTVLYWNLAFGAGVGGWNAFLYESGIWFAISAAACLTFVILALMAADKIVRYTKRAALEERWENRGTSNQTLPFQ